MRVAQRNFLPNAYSESVCVIFSFTLLHLDSLAGVLTSRRAFIPQCLAAGIVA
ncbi:MAG: hypothetical protein ACI9P7_002050 [Candidatus Azotimanducaceae bacterium]|jgi:hypothetical protein